MIMRSGPGERGNAPGAVARTFVEVLTWRNLVAEWVLQARRRVTLQQR